MSAARLTRIRERFADSETTEKVVESSKKVTKKVAEGAGFCAWCVGRMFRPVTKKVRKAFEQYQTEMKEE